MCYYTRYSFFQAEDGIRAGHVTGVQTCALPICRTIPHQVVSAEPMTLLDGTHVDLLALSYEQPVLVYFWATWCGVCRFVSPSVSRLAGGDHTVVSIAIASGESERVHAYQQAKNYRINTINDPRNTLAQA